MSKFVEYTEAIWRGLNMRNLKVDEAYLLLKTLYNKTTYLYALSEECYTCPYSKMKDLEPRVGNGASSEMNAVEVNVAHALKLKLLAQDVGRYAFDNVTALCDFEYKDLQEFGVYNMTVWENGTCSWAIDKPGVNVNLSLVSVFVLISMFLIMAKVCLCAWRIYCNDEVAAVAAAAAPTQVHTGSDTSKTQHKRMRSLDTFRGMSIVLMIFVNSGGGKYWWMEHAPWNGLHLADIVFPSFLWIMGVCIPISVKSQLRRDIPKFRICMRIIWRSFKLFAIGLCLNSLYGPKLEDLRIMGVLQRFGIAYFVCGTLHTIFSQKESIVPQASWQRSVYDLFLFKGEFVVILVLIISYLATIFGLDIPNCPKGYLGPGGKHANGAYPNCIGGATGYIDLQILGDTHIYKHPTAKYVYDSTAFDPEGLFGCLLTIVQVFFGVLTGVIIHVHTLCWARISRWLMWSVILALLGGILSGFSKENGPIPLNKNLWSLSFVCVTTALAFALLSVLYFCIDVRQWCSGYPFEAAGKNAIILYVGHTILHKMLPWHWRMGPMNTHFMLLLEAVWNTSLWIAVALYLDAKRFYYAL